MVQVRKSGECSHLLAKRPSTSPRLFQAANGEKTKYLADVSSEIPSCHSSYTPRARTVILELSRTLRAVERLHDARAGAIAPAINSRRVIPRFTRLPPATTRSCTAPDPSDSVSARGREYGHRRSWSM